MEYVTNISKPPIKIVYLLECNVDEDGFGYDAPELGMKFWGETQEEAQRNASNIISSFFRSESINEPFVIMIGDKELNPNE